MDLEERVTRQQQHIKNQRNQIATLRRRVERLESMLGFCIQDPQIKWLWDNRQERLDPNVPLFDQGRAEFHSDRYRFAAEKIIGIPNARVADIACGTGYGSAMLKLTSVDSVIGVDSCQEAIEYAQTRYSKPGVEFRCKDASSTGLSDKSLDVIVSFETIEHVENETSLIEEFARVLKPNALLICSTPNEWPLEIAPHHVREYNRESFVEALYGRFEVKALYNQNSGTAFRFNRDQERGIVETTENNQHLAECFLAVARCLE